jgi:hypothetical protein
MWRPYAIPISCYKCRPGTEIHSAGKGPKVTKVGFRNFGGFSLKTLQNEEKTRPENPSQKGSYTTKNLAQSADKRILKTGAMRKADPKSPKPYEGLTNPERKEIPGKNLRFAAGFGFAALPFYG